MSCPTVSLEHSASRCGGRRDCLKGNGMSQDTLSDFVEATAKGLGIPGVAVGV
jgi:hypothetical protein